LSNDLERFPIYVGQDEVYLIDGLELDAEFDYISPEERLEATVELDNYIQENAIQPTRSSEGYVEANEDMIVYVPATGDVAYADGFDMSMKEKDDQNRKYVILDKLSNGYPIHTDVESMFKACKVNALSQIPKVDQDDLRYARHEFEQYSLQDKIHFIENVYDYQIVNPTPQNVREWEKFHGVKWTYDIKEMEYMYVIITFLKDTHCLMVTKSDELVNVKFYNGITEVPQTKEEEQRFLKVLEKDAETMMKVNHSNKATL